MASTSATMAVDSPASQRWSYDAFLSFRGEDTRNNFVGHLLGSLSRKGIHTFFDDRELKRGEQITPALEKAIEGSHIAIVVFSENYASSTWCLDELSKIVECSESGGGQTLIPVFYKVEPSIVRKQPLGSASNTALEKHEEKNQDKVQKWRDALRKASNFAGEHFDNGSEADFVEKIARLVSERIGRQPLLDVAKNPVGLDSEIEKVKPLLRIGKLEKACFIGIVGTGGMGKTTLAKAIYIYFAEHFEGCSFLANVREESEKYKSLVKLQKRLLSDCLGGEKIDVANEDSGITLIRSRLQNRRCLIVIDDVDKPHQMEKLAGGCDWFGPGSRVIVTTRDEHLLDQVGASKHRMEGLCDDHARSLLSWSAFGKASPLKDYAKVFSAVLDYAKGLPLAVRVLGSFLCGRDVSLWESTMERLKKFPNSDIFNVLKVSYDGLDEDQKAIFLYIACLFRRTETKDDVVKILNGCGYDSEIGIEVLTERSLITIIQEEWLAVLDMHDLIKEMGKDIARREKKSMLWTYEEIRSVLEDNTGTDAIRAIYWPNYLFGNIHLNPTAFKKMPMLQMLILRGYEVSCGPVSLPDELRWLEWNYYPWPSLPPDFNPSNLGGLILTRSKKMTKLWDGQKMGPNMKVIGLHGCSELREIPDVSGMPNLKELDASCCYSLVRVHESVGYLEKLEVLNFECCRSLRELPMKFRLPSLQRLGLKECEELEKFPDILGRMENIKALDLSLCKVLREVPDISGMPNLEELRVDGCTRLVRVHESVGSLEKLEILSFEDCTSLRELPTELILPSLQRLGLRGCRGLEKFPDTLGRMENVKALHLSFCEVLREVPDISGMPNLEELRVDECTRLVTVHESVGSLEKLEVLSFNGCRSLREVPMKLRLPSLQRLGLRGCRGLEKFPEICGRMENVKALDLSFCEILREVPDVSGMPNLEELRFIACTKLVTVHESVGSLVKLEVLNFNGCWSLRELPKKLILPSLQRLGLKECRGLEEFPDIFGRMENVKALDLSFCEILREVPDISGMPNLEELRVDMCTRLVTVHESVGSLEKLEILNFTQCNSLRELPMKLKLPSLQHLGLRECCALEKFPDIFGRMENVKALDLSFCEILREVPDISGMSNLEELRVDDCRMLVTVHESVVSLEKLEILSFRDSWSLRELPMKLRLPSLQTLDIRCNNLEKFPDILSRMDHLKSFTLKFTLIKELPPSFENLTGSWLENLDLQGNTALKTLPRCICQLPNLRDLNVSYSENLKEIPELPPRLEVLRANGCNSLETVETQSLRLMGKIDMDFNDCHKLREKEELLSEWLKGHEERMTRSTSFLEEVEVNFKAMIPGGEIPDRFYHGRTSSSIDKEGCLRFRVHSQSGVLRDLAGFALFAAFSKEHSYIGDSMWLMYINGKEVCIPEMGSYNAPGHVWIIYIHLKNQWKEEMMKRVADGWIRFSFELKTVADGWIHLSFEPRNQANKSLESIGVAFIGKSGEDLNPSTEIHHFGKKKRELLSDWIMNCFLSCFKDE